MRRLCDYPVTLTKEGERVLVSFADFPDVHTFGEEEQEALARAVDALETMLIGRMEDRDEIPEPGRIKRGQRSVALSALSARRSHSTRKCELPASARPSWPGALHCHLPQVDRLLDLRHASRLDQMEHAFLALGKRLSISLEDAA